MLPMVKKDPDGVHLATQNSDEQMQMDVNEVDRDAPAQKEALSGDDTYEDEEITLFADFDICLDMEDPNLLIKVIGIESESPVIQVNDEVYRGTTDFAFGTFVFFEKDQARTASLDPVFEANIKDMYQYVEKTDKVLRMKRIFLTDKEQIKQEPVAPTSQEESSAEESIDRKDQLEVPMTYEEALNLHLAEGCVTPRHIIPNLNGAALVQKPADKGESSRNG